MKDKAKTKEQLINELVELRQRMTELEASETERKQAEEALAESERKYRSLFEQMLNGFAYCKILVDEDNQPTDFVHLEVNDAFERLTGLRKEDVIGRKVTEAIPGTKESHPELFSIYGRVALTGEPTQFDLYFKPLAIWLTISVYSPQKGFFVAVFENITERKQADEKIASLAKFPSENPNPVLRVAKDGTILYANKASLPLLAIWGCQTGQLLPDYLRQSISRVLGSGSPENIEFECEEQVFSFMFSPIVDACYVNLYGRDITERKQVEETLQESAMTFRRIFDAIPDPAYLHERQADGRIILTQANKAAMAITRGKIEDFIGSELGQQPLGEPEIISKTKQTLETGEMQREEAVYKQHTTGEEKWLLVDYVKTAEDSVLTITTDITELKRMEEALRQAAEEWRTTFDSFVDLVSIQDKDFRLIRVNKAYADAIKMKPRELIGKTCYEVFHGTKEPWPDCPHKRTLVTKKPATVEFFEPRLGVHLEVTTSPVFNEKGEVVGSVRVARDITERKQMQEQLIVTDRLASVGQLASGIAHELNNPLTGVIGFSQLLLERDIPEDIREDIATINHEAQRTAEVVKNLLTFARKHPPLKQPVNINDIIEKVLELRAYEQRVNNIKVITHFAPDLPEVMGDYFQLQQVFLNIIINAEYFMAEAHNKGTLTITTKKAGNVIKASFADDGPGISKEYLGHVFDPFFTTKEVGKGTGLGLSICHGIVTEHGGQIYAESELGKGVTFAVELPIATANK